MPLVLVGTLVLLGLGFAPPAHALPIELITNGSFETGDFSGWVTKDLTFPFFPLRVDGAGVSPGFGLFNSAPTDGSFAALHGFDGDGPDTIRLAQDVLIPAGPTILSFDFRTGWDLITFCFSCTGSRTFDINIEPAGGGANRLNVNFLTATPGTLVSDTGNLNGTLNLSSFTGSSIRVSFDFFIPESDTGPAFFQLDNVSLTTSPIPEPGTLLLIASGLVGTALSTRRRRRRQ